MKRKLLIIAGLVLGGGLLLPLLAQSRTPMGDIVRCLPVGWFHFLQRNAPKITANWNIIGMGFLCTVALLVLGNWLLGALYRQFQAVRSPEQPAKPWRWRWTFALYAGVWLLFAIAFGATGVYRQSSWLMEYEQPWHEERLHPYSEFRRASMVVGTLMADNDDDLEQTRKAFLAEDNWRRGKSLLCEDFQVVFYGKADNKIGAYVIIPRQPQLLKKGLFGVVTPLDKKDLIRPLSQLQETFATLDAAFPLKR
jgi:hypothetical protein